MLWKPFPETHRLVVSLLSKTAWKILQMSPFCWQERFFFFFSWVGCCALCLLPPWQLSWDFCSPPNTRLWGWVPHPRWKPSKRVALQSIHSSPLCVCPHADTHTSLNNLSDHCFTLEKLNTRVYICPWCHDKVCNSQSPWTRTSAFRQLQRVPKWNYDFIYDFHEMIMK